MTPVPKSVAEQYGGARAFRALKRQQLKALDRAYADLRVGCAYFPCGVDPFEEIEKQLEALQKALSREVWGQ